MIRQRSRNSKKHNNNYPARYPVLWLSNGIPILRRIRTRDLQAQLEGTENRIAVARKRYVEASLNTTKG